MQKYAKVCKSLQKHAKQIQNIQKQEKVCRSLKIILKWKTNLKNAKVRNIKAFK